MRFLPMPVECHLIDTAEETQTGRPCPHPHPKPRPEDQHVASGTLWPSKVVNELTPLRRVTLSLHVFGPEEDPEDWVSGQDTGDAFGTVEATPDPYHTHAPPDLRPFERGRWTLS